VRILFLGFFIFLWGCSQETPIPDRYDKIPADAVKVTPENDKFHPFSIPVYGKTLFH